MTTIRSYYQYEQFEEILQKLAHKIAKEAVKKLPQEAKILIGDHRVTHIETSDIKIRFFSKRASVYKTTSPHHGLYFEVEKKLYLNSNHSSKISFPTPYGLWTPEGVDYTKTAAETEKKKKQVEDFINKLMSGVTLVPRFSLKQYTESAGPHEEPEYCECGTELTEENMWSEYTCKSCAQELGLTKDDPPKEVEE